MKNKTVHVIRNKSGGWQVKKGGAKRATSKHRTQALAKKKAEKIAKVLKIDTKIHGRDGKIRGGNSYGNDPHPPKDKK